MDEKLSAYVQQIEQLFPSLRVTSAHLNSDGLANDVVIVNQELAFRFAKSEESRTALAREARILDVVRRALSLPVPVFEYQQPGMVMYRFLPGKPLYRTDLLRLPPVRQEMVAAQLAQFLRELHDIPLEALGADGLVEIDNRREHWMRRRQQAEQLLYPLLWRDQKDWIAELFAPLEAGTLRLDEFEPVLVHNDLASYHLLFDSEQGQLIGVIDFGVAGAGDPADDVALLINTYGESFVRRMHADYPLSPELLDRARFKSSALELEWAIQGLRTQDLSWLLVHLGRARDSLPVHTRENA